MTRTNFLDRDHYWKEITSRVPSAKKVVAAVAYLGSNGSDYLPLRAGDELVVDQNDSEARTAKTARKTLVYRWIGVYRVQ